MTERLEIIPEIARPTLTARPDSGRGSASSRWAVLHTRTRPGPPAPRRHCARSSPHREGFSANISSKYPRKGCRVQSPRAGPTLTALQALAPSSPTQALLQGLVLQDETRSPGSATCPRSTEPQSAASATCRRTASCWPSQERQTLTRGHRLVWPQSHLACPYLFCTGLVANIRTGYSHPMPHSSFVRRAEVSHIPNPHDDPQREPRGPTPVPPPRLLSCALPAE